MIKTSGNGHPYTAVWFQSSTLLVIDFIIVGAGALLFSDSGSLDVNKGAADKAPGSQAAGHLQDFSGDLSSYFVEAATLLLGLFWKAIRSPQSWERTELGTQRSWAAEAPRRGSKDRGWVWTLVHWLRWAGRKQHIGAQWKCFLITISNYPLPYTSLLLGGSSLDSCRSQFNVTKSESLLVHWAALVRS